MTTRTVVSRTRRVERPVSREFAFTRDMVPALGTGDGYPEFLKAYRSKAWEAFESSPMPTTTDEAWRRTDIRGLEAGSFSLPDKDSAQDAPIELLQPVAGEQHGGQLILTPGDRPGSNWTLLLFRRESC